MSPSQAKTHLRKNVYRALGSAGVSSLVRDSAWRQDRLVILCYHGVSLSNEHEWDPELFLSPSVFRDRLAFLRQQRYNVLPLGEALSHLQNQSLPPRSVVLTFDDGFYDFYSVAVPILREFDFPATVYLTTYYCYVDQPIFQLMASYLLWLARGRRLPPIPEIGIQSSTELGDSAARARLVGGLKQREEQENWTIQDREHLLRKLAALCEAPYEEIRRRRILEIMKPEEVKTLQSSRVDVELHTHRHRTPSDEKLFRREIRDNLTGIQALTGQRACHFCYPSGVYLPSFFPWLADEGVVSATTCKPGIVARPAPIWELPRYVDTMYQGMADFSCWVSGVAGLLR